MKNWHDLVNLIECPTVTNQRRIDRVKSDVVNATSGLHVHLAVCVEPYLSAILSGKKTVESRFSVYRQAPFGRVAPGDVVILKRSGGPIVGVCQIACVWSYHLDPRTFREIRRDFAEALHAQDPNFWKERRNAAYATLMSFEWVSSTLPLFISKQDRRGWVVLG